MSSQQPAVVSVPVTTVWIAPDRPRSVDAAIVADLPDAVAWVAALDADAARGTGAAGGTGVGPGSEADAEAASVDDNAGGDSDSDSDTDSEAGGRLGLHGRVETQLVEGEPVLVVGHDPSGAWAQVLAPWQPSPKSPLGYPGWVPAAHLSTTTPAASTASKEPSGPTASETDGQAASGEVDARPGDPASGPVATVDLDSLDSLDAEHPALALAREHLGLPYLWGGLTPLGLDCSGLVHHTWRRFGIVVPRDAYAQAESATPVALDAVEPGDLYFFGHPGKRIHHVGIVVSPGRMVHASETGAVLVEENLGPDRLATLVAAGRLPHP